MLEDHMKKKIARLNRGFVLLIIAVIALAVYIIADSIRANNEKASIRILANDFIHSSDELLSVGKISSSGSMSTSTSVFSSPSPISIPEADSEEAKAKLSKLKPYIFDSKTLFDELLRCQQTLYTSIFEEYGIAMQSIKNRSILSMRISIYNNTASVSCTVSNEYRTQDGKDEIYTSSDLIEFEKYDGRWVIVRYSVY